LERFGFSEHGTEGLNPQEAVMVVESVCQNRQGVQLAWNFFKAALWIPKSSISGSVLLERSIQYLQRRTLE
jgi:hypothetical protein